MERLSRKTDPVNGANALQRLIFVCPDYLDRWRGKRANDHVDDIEPRLEYMEAGDVADWVVERMVAKDHACMAELFAVVEELLLTGSDEVQMLIKIGFLEAIQFGLGEAADDGVEPDDLLHYFGPQTRKEWFDLLSWLNRPSTA